MVFCLAFWVRWIAHHRSVPSCRWGSLTIANDALRDKWNKSAFFYKDDTLLFLSKPGEYVKHGGAPEVLPVCPQQVLTSPPSQPDPCDLCLPLAPVVMNSGWHRRAPSETTIITTICQLSKAVHLVPCPEFPSASPVRVPPPRHFSKDTVSDQDLKFPSQVWKTFYHSFGTNCSLNSGSSLVQWPAWMGEAGHWRPPCTAWHHLYWLSPWSVLPQGCHGDSWSPQPGGRSGDIISPGSVVPSPMGLVGCPSCPWTHHCEEPSQS